MAKNDDLGYQVDRALEQQYLLTSKSAYQIARLIFVNYGASDPIYAMYTGWMLHQTFENGLRVYLMRYGIRPPETHSLLDLLQACKKITITGDSDEGIPEVLQIHQDVLDCCWKSFAVQQIVEVPSGVITELLDASENFFEMIEIRAARFDPASLNVAHAYLSNFGTDQLSTILRHATGFDEASVDANIVKTCGIECLKVVGTRIVRKRKKTAASLSQV